MLEKDLLHPLMRPFTCDIPGSNLSWNEMPNYMCCQTADILIFICVSGSIKEGILQNQALFVV